MNGMALVLAAAVGLAGCSDDGGGRTESQPPLQRASEGLCKAQVRAGEGDVPGAAEVFQAETHDYLHELARILRARDPRAGALLLETKQRVEEALGVPERADPAEVVQLLLGLQRAFIAGAEAAGLPRPLCRSGAV
jgi:hypothetical protein